MLNDLPVLVAEAENFSAMAFVMTVEDLNGRAVGPAASVSVAMALLQSREIGAAIVDLDLEDRDAMPVARQLRAWSIPFVLYTSRRLPLELQNGYPPVKVVMKPSLATSVVLALAGQLPGS